MRRIMLMMALLTFCLVVRAQESASQILRKSEEAFRTSQTLVADFNSQSAAGASTGTITLSRDRFFLDAGGIQTWFDGKTQWSYLPSSDEVNILVPTQEQLQSINPYSYLNLTKEGYTAKLGKSSLSSRSVVLLETKDKKKAIQTLYLEIDRSSWLPYCIIINDRDASTRTRIDVIGYQKQGSLDDGFFRFDVGNHPDTEIIDLR